MIALCVYISSGVRLSFSKKLLYSFLEDLFIFANSEDPNEMQYYAAFYRGLLCLQNY